MKKYLLLIFGSLSLAVGLYFFLIQHEIAAGGVSGFSLVLSTLVPGLSVGIMNMFMNILVLGLGTIILGFNFAKKSLFTALSLSAFIIVFERVFPDTILTNDIIINIIFGGIFMSFGLAIIFHNGSSTGGTDLIASIVNRKLKVPIHISMFMADFIVISMSIIVFGIEKALYAILAILIQSIGIDYFIQGFGRKIAILVISEKYDVINEKIIKKYNRGVTLFKAEGGFSHKDKKVIMTVTTIRRYPKLREDILALDDRAFIFTYQVSEVLGEGFTLDPLK